MTARHTSSKPLPQLQRKHWWKLMRLPSTQQLGMVLLSVLMACALTWLAHERSGGVLPRLVPGDVATATVIAPKDFEVTDVEATEKEKASAEARIRNVFAFDRALGGALASRLGEAFQAARDAGPDLRGDAFTNTLDADLPEVVLATLESSDFSQQLESDARALLLMAMGEPVVRDGETLHRAPVGFDILYRGSEGVEEKKAVDPGQVVELKEARKRLAKRASDVLPERNAALLETVLSLVQTLLAPTLVFDASATANRRIEARAQVSPITQLYRRGQVIVREGDIVTVRSAGAVEALERAQNKRAGLGRMVSLGIVLWLTMLLVFVFGERFVRKFPADRKHATALSAVLLVVGISVALSQALGQGLATVFPEIPAGIVGYATPVAATVVLVRVLMNSETAVLFALVVIPFAAVGFPNSPALAFYHVLGALAGAAALSRGTERGRLLIAGMWATAAQALVLFLLVLPEYSPGGAVEGQLAVSALAVAMASGIGGTIVIIGLMPLFDGAGFLTDVRLLELANLNHPLLRDMLVKAPGSYTHSMMVGALSEAAAESVGCNALLCRVGSYFHDVGKTLKPAYFIENQRGVGNPHDHLAPSMSALVIANHVKDGMDLAHQHRLPQALIELIPQHHGNGRIEYFYNKAKQQEDPEISKVDESDYRYPGPRPQTREAGVIMLADGVEAATRSLKETTPGSVSVMIEKIINSKMADGQLDECPLTLRDLRVCADSFAHTVLAIHHQRIAYPEPGAIAAAGGRSGLVPKSITLTVPPLGEGDQVEKLPATEEAPDPATSASGGHEPANEAKKTP